MFFGIRVKLSNSPWACSNSIIASLCSSSHQNLDSRSCLVINSRDRSLTYQYLDDTLIKKCTTNINTIFVLSCKQFYRIGPCPVFWCEQFYWIGPCPVFCLPWQDPFNEIVIIWVTKLYLLTNIFLKFLILEKWIQWESE